MAGSASTTTAEPQPGRSAWPDLVFYLVAGFGLFGLASYGVSLAFEELSLLAVATLYGLNFLCLGGTVYLLGVRRHRVTWSEIGLIPIRWRWHWLLIASGLTILLMPLRGIAGFLAQMLIEGSLESLQVRQEIVTAGGLSWAGLVVTLLGVGIVAPISEELFFRGLIHRWFQGRFGLPVRLFLSSALFGLAHADSAGVVAASFVLGVVLALAYERSRSLWLPIAIHSVNNSIAVVLVYLGMASNQFLPVA